MADNATIETIKAIGAIITPIALAWIAMKQMKMGRKQDVIHGQINGMQEKLITAEKSASKQEGNTEGRSELKHEQAEEKK